MDMGDSMDEETRRLVQKHQLQDDATDDCTYQEYFIEYWIINVMIEILNWKLSVDAPSLAKNSISLFSSYQNLG